MARVRKATGSSDSGPTRKVQNQKNVVGGVTPGLRMRSASDANKPASVSNLDSFLLKNKENDGLHPVIGDGMAPVIKTGSLKASLEEARSEHHLTDKAAADLTESKAEEKKWRELAEERRLALEETLKENEKLSDENELLLAENAHLKGLVDRAAKLEELLLGLGYALE